MLHLRKPGSTGACKESIHVSSSGKAWPMLLTGLLSPVQCSDCADVLKRCECHQNLSDLLVPVLPLAASLWECGCACKENPSVSKERSGRLCHRADAICLGCQPWA